jgi:hypothetical protein
LTVGTHPPSTAQDAGAAPVTISLDALQLETTLEAARAGDTLVRIDTSVSSAGTDSATVPSSSGADAAATDLLGGIIVRESGLKGVLSTKVPVSSPASIPPASSTSTTRASTTSTSSATRAIPNTQIVSAAGPTRLTITIVPIGTPSAACQARITALQTLIGSLESVRDDYQRRIAELTRQAQVFEQLALQTPSAPPEMLAVKQGYEAQARALRAQIQSLALAMADVQLQLAQLRSELVEAQRGVNC